MKKEISPYKIIPAKQNKKKWKVVKTEDPRSFYVVEEKEKVLTCTCPGYTYRATCKHLQMIQHQYPSQSKKNSKHRPETVQRRLQDFLEEFSPIWQKYDFCPLKKQDTIFKIIVVGDVDQTCAALTEACIPYTHKIQTASFALVSFFLQGCRVDLFFTVLDSWGATKACVTGPIKFVNTLKGKATFLNYRLNGEGLWSFDRGCWIPVQTERQLFRKLRLTFVPVEKRLAYL